MSTCFFSLCLLQSLLSDEWLSSKHHENGHIGMYTWIENFFSDSDE